MLDATTLPITFENTRLRPLFELDAGAYAAGTKDEAVRRFGHLPESDYTPESVRRMIRDEVAEGLSSGTLAVLALADAETDRFVGSCRGRVLDSSGCAGSRARSSGPGVGIALRTQQWIANLDSTHAPGEQGLPAVLDERRVP